MGNSMSKKKALHTAGEIIFPLLLLLLPLLKINQGIDLSDTPYNLGNYRFFAESEGVWVLSTFLSNVIGYVFTKLPFGGTMLGMKFYGALIVSAMALFSYRFFKTKMPSWVAFLGEVAAIGFCWCPVGILYHYLSYFFFLLGVVFLFRALAGCRPVCLVVAGVCLGLNVAVRVPNVLEVVLIVALWYYGSLKKKSFEEIAKETGLCVAGFLGAQLLMFGVMSALYGIGAYPEMIGGLFGIAGRASDYTFGEMLASIFSAYLTGFKWMLYMLLCILPGIPFMIIKKEKFPLLRKGIYCVCILFLFFVLGKWGMYNLKYYQKESALQWGVVFLLLSIGVCIWMLLTREADDEWKLIGILSLVVILITPLGSNNYVWPILNNLFFAAPVTFWMIYRFARWGRTYLDTTGKVPLFSAKAMLLAMVLAFLVQSVGLLGGYVFRDGEGGEKRSAVLSNNPVLTGMYTTPENAKALDELSLFVNGSDAAYEGKKLILYGNIPGLSYYLDRAPALSTSWPDLASSDIESLRTDLAEIAGEISQKGQKPLVIFAAQTMEKDSSEDEKLKLIREFVNENDYRQVFVNDAFVVYE